MTRIRFARGAAPALVLALALAAPLHAQQTKAPAKAAPAAAARAVKGPTVEGITQYTLPNGLEVLLFPDASKPTTTVNITYFVGSRFEDYGETGMAHLFEHMLFKGSTHHPNIPQELTEHGAQPNGTTWVDRTNFFEVFPATAANLDWALDLEADRMVHSFIAKKDLESEMTVVRNEYEMGENSPFNILMERVLSTAYLWHAYGHSTIGARSDIENVPIERLHRFYHKYYQPDNALLMIAGKFDPAQALALVEKKFGAIPKPKRTGADVLVPTYTVEPTQDGERTVTLRRVGDVQVVMAGYHVPAGSSPGFAAVDVLSEVLGASPAGRLYKALVDTRKASDVGSDAFQFHDPGMLLAFAQVRKEDSLDSARVALEQALADVVKTPPTAEEVERGKATILKNIDLTLNSSMRVGLEISEWAAMGDWRLMFLFRDRVKAVTPADVQRVAAAYLKPSNLTLGEFVPTEKPDRAEIPAAGDVAAMVKDYKGDAQVAQGEAFDPSPANIDSRTTRRTLADGFQVALLPKKTRGETVNAEILLRLGSEQALMNMGATPDMAADMLMRGTKEHTRQQLKDELDRLKARVSVSGGATSASVRIETTRPNLPAVLRLVGEVLREPAFDSTELETLRTEDLAQVEQQRSEPQVLAFTEYQRKVSPWPKGHPRYVQTPDEAAASYKAATLAQVKDFYHRFYGAASGAMAVVGDFDAAQVGALADSMFGGWKAPEAYQHIAEAYHANPAVDESLETPDKANAMFVAGATLDLKDTSPDYPALLLGNYMLGGGFLNSRLATRIRQKEGLSYGVGSVIQAGPLDPVGQFITYAIYAPQNADRLEAAFKEEMQRALADGFTPDEVQKAREGYLQSARVGRAQDAGLAAQLATELLYGRTMEFTAAQEKAIAALTPAQIVAVLRKYIDLSRLTIVKAGDFKGAAAKVAPTPKP